jgi:hypothetical protein
LISVVEKATDSAASDSSAATPSADELTRATSVMKEEQDVSERGPPCADALCGDQCRLGTSVRRALGGDHASREWGISPDGARWGRPRGRRFFRAGASIRADCAKKSRCKRVPFRLLIQREPLFPSLRRAPGGRLAQAVLNTPSHPTWRTHMIKLTKKTLGTLMLSSSMLLVPTLALAKEPPASSGASAPAKDSSAKKKHHDKKSDQKKDDSKKN